MGGRDKGMGGRGGCILGGIDGVREIVLGRIMGECVRIGFGKKELGEGGEVKCVGEKVYNCGRIIN